MKLSAPGLAGWLAIVTAILVTLAVAAVSIAGIDLLQRLAEAEALTRVELATTTARESLHQSTEDLATAVQVLAERPTLQRLLGDRARSTLRPYLERYCKSAAFDACAVFRKDTLLTATGEKLDWEQVIAAGAEQGQRFLVTGAGSQFAHAGASATLPGDTRTTVIALRQLGEQLAKRLGERAGLEIRILDYTSFDAGEGPLAVLDSDALSRGSAVAGYVDEIDAFAASMPVFSSTGETIALLQALLPQDQLANPVAKLTGRLLLIALIVALLATAGGILIGRNWIAGVQRLTNAASRIGSGDLSASIPEERNAELGILAKTMDEMRRNLVALTSELRRSEAEAQAVISGIVEGVYAVDRDRRIRFLNPQAEKLLKVSSADAVGRFCGDVLKPAADNQGRRPCDHACPILAARRAGTGNAVERIEPLNGRVRRVVIASAASIDDIQVQVLRDETELEAVRRTRDTVLANISHEFRTPLAAQLASIELLKDGLGTMTTLQQRALVDSLQRGAQRLTWLIDNLLESVRIETGQLAIRRQVVNLTEVIDAARDLVEPLLQQRDQRLDVTIPETLPAIYGDQQRLVQVVVNLLANASKFGPPGSGIRIGGAATEQGGIIFWIDDEGSGPADPSDTALFEQFHRSGGEDPDESGLGLGLYIVRSIAERHGGRAWLSRTPDSRTRVQVELPGGRTQ